ncbi:MAG: M14 family metallopeptidase [Gammaproteobacteria bacterium]
MNSCFRFAGLAVALLFSIAAAGDPLAPESALERSGYMRLTTSAEVSTFSEQLALLSPCVRKEQIGRSAGGRSIDAIWISKPPPVRATKNTSLPRLTILLVGTQHGTEPSGGEALLLVARSLALGGMKSLLDGADFIIVPNANPDGRDLHRRVNANNVNLSTDFVLLSQPESRAINDLLLRVRPEVVLDVHESAILKKKTLGREGYLTDFNAQFEIGNNANIAPEIRRLSLDRMLPEIVREVRRRGLPAQRYIGEITSIRQPITNGGLSLKNLRNKAGMLGTFSFLVENRLDPPGNYPTHRNLRERVAEQILSIESFLKVVRAHAQKIMAITRTVRMTPMPRSVYLYTAYERNKTQPRISLQLRRRDTGVTEKRWFDDHRAVATAHKLDPPQAYVVTAHEQPVAAVLTRHHLRYKKITNRRKLAVYAQKIKADGNPLKPGEPVAIHAYPVELFLEPGDLWIEARQPEGLILPFLLDPRSISSIFAYPPFNAALGGGREFFVYRVPSQGSAARGVRS